MKKRILLITFVAGCLVQSYSQSSSRNSVLKDGDKVTFFTGPFSRTNWMNNLSAKSNFGGGAGLYFNHKYYVYIQTTSCPVEKSSDDLDKFVMNMIGASVGYCINPLKKVHFVTGTQIYKSTVINKKDINPVHVELNYLMLSPEVYVEVNLLSYVRLYAGPSYSFAIGNDTYNWVNHNYLSGFSFNIGLLVGRF